MNKIWNQLTRLKGTEKPERKVQAKTSGKLFNWCQDQLKPLGLHIDNATPYQLAVYREGDVVGYYDTLTEIKKAIKNNTVSEPYNK